MARHPARPPEADAEKTEPAVPATQRIEDAIERALEGKVARRDLPDVARRITRIAVSEQFSGPMPHPKHLREYEDTLPGAAERILAMAERNLDHGATMERAAMQAEIADRKLGMWMGAGLFALMIGAAFGTLFVTENPVIPGLFLGAAAIGGVVAFIKGRNGGA